MSSRVIAPVSVEELCLFFFFWPSGIWSPALYLWNSLWFWWKVESASHYSQVRAQSLSHVQLCDLMDSSLPGSSVHGISQARKNTGVGCHFWLQGILLTQGLNPCLLPGRFFTTAPPGKPCSQVDLTKQMPLVGEQLRSQWDREGGPGSFCSVSSHSSNCGRVSQDTFAVILDVFAGCVASKFLLRLLSTGGLSISIFSA